jgi:hypothetical protein
MNLRVPYKGEMFSSSSTTFGFSRRAQLHAVGSLYRRICSMSAPHVKIVPVRCASATNVFCRDADVFKAKKVTLNHILCYYYYYMYICMSEYYPFSSHDGITTGNVLVLLFSPVNDNVIFHGIIAIII